MMPNEQGTYIEERNMWVTHFSKDFYFDLAQIFKTEIGGSYWHSQLDNKLSHQQGKRDTWSVFATTTYENWQWLLLAGQQKVDNADVLHPDDSTFGSFDSSYQVANSGQFLRSEINYLLQQPFEQISEIKPYLSYSKYDKDQAGYLDSERLNAGLYFFYKRIGVQAEYIISKNDPAVGGSTQSLAQGDNHKTNQLFALAIGYFF